MKENNIYELLVLIVETRNANQEFKNSQWAESINLDIKLLCGLFLHHCFHDGSWKTAGWILWMLQEGYKLEDSEVAAKYTEFMQG